MTMNRNMMWVCGAVVAAVLVVASVSGAGVLLFVIPCMLMMGAMMWMMGRMGGSPRGEK